VRHGLRGAPHLTTVSDPGVQGERTYLAWRRTGLSFGAVGGGIIHFSDSGLQIVPEVIGVCGIAAGAAFVILATYRYRHSAQAAAGERPAAIPAVVLATGLTALVLAVGALVIVLGD